MSGHISSNQARSIIVRPPTIDQALPTAAPIRPHLMGFHKRTIILEVDPTTLVPRLLVCKAHMVSCI